MSAVSAMVSRWRGRSRRRPAEGKRPVSERAPRAQCPLRLIAEDIDVAGAEPARHHRRGVAHHRPDILPPAPSQGPPGRPVLDPPRVPFRQFVHPPGRVGACRQPSLVVCFVSVGHEKAQDSRFWQGANRSNSRSDCEDEQRRQGHEDKLCRFEHLRSRPQEQTCDEICTVVDLGQWQ